MKVLLLMKKHTARGRSFRVRSHSNSANTSHTTIGSYRGELFLQKPELLSPASCADVFYTVVESQADAVCLSGRLLNREDSYFGRMALPRMVKFAHDHGKKVYVDVHPLVDAGELAEHLNFLQQAGIDAIILQDMEMVKLCLEH